ncbi:sensor histidine kinase [Arthrobacter sp. 92]|uniref:sensor histidine kinase n=1 Tax=Arthrobacter sp. 92 TaxID=3418175 RepID=UPI003D008049
MSGAIRGRKAAASPGPDPPPGRRLSDLAVLRGATAEAAGKLRDLASPSAFGGNLRLLRAKTQSVRFRVLATMLVLMCAGLALAGFITYALEFRDLDNRVDQSLLDRTRQIQKLAAHPADKSAMPVRAGSAGTVVERISDAVDQIDTSRHEVIAVLIDGRVAWKAEGNPDQSLLSGDKYDGAAALLVPDRTVLGDLSAGQPLRIAVSPVSGAPEGRTVLIVGRSSGDQRDRILASMRTYMLVSGGTLAVSGVVGGLLAGRLLAPLRRLREATEIVSHKDLTRRIDVRNGVDDVAQLARTFNTMLQRLDDGVREQQQFMDDAGHELRTPLTIIRGHLELMSVHDPAEVAGTRDLVLEEADRMQRLVDDLLLLANTRQPDFLRREKIRVVDFTAHVMEKIRVLADRRWQIDETADTVIVADPQRLTQALVQLAANAVKYTDSTSTIAVGSRIEHAAAAVVAGSPATGRRMLALWMRDTGSGILAEDQHRIFDRFARAVPGRGPDGSGLGLAIVSAIAEAHGGHVSLKSAYGSGSTFSLLLPASDRESAR